MPVPARMDIEQLIAAVVSERLHVPVAALLPATDLRGYRSFSSFMAVGILEDLESAFDVEIPADQLSAERLCSVAVLTDLFAQALHEHRAMTQ